MPEWSTNFEGGVAGQLVPVGGTSSEYGYSIGVRYSNVRSRSGGLSIAHSGDDPYNSVGDYGAAVEDASPPYYFETWVWPQVTTPVHGLFSGPTLMGAFALGADDSYVAAGHTFRPTGEIRCEILMNDVAVHQETLPSGLGGAWLRSAVEITTAGTTLTLYDASGSILHQVSSAAVVPPAEKCLLLLDANLANPAWGTQNWLDDPLIRWGDAVPTIDDDGPFASAYFS